VITALTKEQEALMVEVRDQWTAIGHSTESADFAAAETAIGQLYAAAKLPLPRRIERVASPLAGERLAVSFGVSGLMCDWGQHDVGWLAFYDYFRRIGVRYDPEKNRLLDAFMVIARSCGWWWPMDEAVILSDRPAEIHTAMRNERHVLHNVNGPAIRYRDGFAVYAVMGARVPAWIIEKPESIVAKDVLIEQNAEVRRVMIDLMTPAKFFAQADPQVLDEDHDESDMPRRLLRIDLNEDEPYVVLEVQCPSTGHKAMLRVSPDNRTCLQAVVSTFPGMTVEDYLDLVSA